MRTLGKLSSFATAAGLAGLLTMAVVPAQAQISPEGSNALLGAGIGAIAGGVLGHGNIGPVLGGAAAGAAVGALVTPHRDYYYGGYGYPYANPYYGGQYSYNYESPYYPSTTNSYPYGYSSYPYGSYGYYGAYGY